MTRWIDYSDDKTSQDDDQGLRGNSPYASSIRAKMMIRVHSNAIIANVKRKFGCSVHTEKYVRGCHSRPSVEF